MRDADAGKKQPQVVIHFRGRANSRAGRSRRIALPDGDCRSNSQHFVDFRFFDTFEELARIGGKRFDIPPLAFRIDRVEGQ